MESAHQHYGSASSSIALPDFGHLLADSGKLYTLDRLLTRYATIPASRPEIAQSHALLFVNNTICRTVGFSLNIESSDSTTDQINEFFPPLVFFLFVSSCCFCSV